MKFLLLFLLISFEAIALDISVLTWNTFLIPSPFNSTKQDERAELMAEKLRGLDRDIIFFQEAFFDSKREAIIKELQSLYPYVAVPKDDQGIFQIQDSGLFILSKFPMKILDQVTFNDCTNTDCLAAKGAIIVELTLSSRKKIQMIGTHLQAWNDQKSVEVRKKQLLQIKNMMRANAKIGVAQILVGDLNIDGKLESEFSESLALMEMVSSPLEGKIGSSNGFSTVNCFDNPGGLAEGEWLDHVWLSSNGSDTEVYAKKIIPIVGKIGNTECPLSDHYAVEAHVKVKKNQIKSLSRS